MKKKMILSLLLMFAAAGSFTACKKDKNKDSDPCARLEFVAKTTADYTKPCGLAISKSGMVAVSTYNGFSGYGLYGPTSVWKSYSDFLAKAQPLIEFSSRGAEAAAFDNDENLYIAETEGTAGIRTYRKVIQGGAVTYQYNSLIQGNGISGGFVNPRGIAFDDNGRMYIANDGRGNLVRVTNPMGAATVQIIASDLGSIKGMAISGKTMYLTSYVDGSVMRCTLKSNGDFSEITGVYKTNHPVDVALTNGALAIATPEDGKVTLIDPDKLPAGNNAYTGCTKELQVGTNVFGMAFTPDGKGLLASHLNGNQVKYFTN
ncbi:hypothetical protein D0C36_04235 [Mucilaginibacter conchicola]|uniref:SMP-30/Gluconolactonase/LRE-like region domain-containing protein n=1 Tax=Mucilaginibacter conchicola TaxID=2303333 RepID=A0A372NXJ2_9SPHI|nr:hypothetical protein [Mucilaginibacter conchicola]RFZ94752.1 hypothetical protein D0C36_04235 [Mucilaginibacter conchicola]